MDFMKKEYLAERAPANVMEWARERTTTATAVAVYDPILIL